jgi:hypothetical protein
MNKANAIPTKSQNVIVNGNVISFEKNTFWFHVIMNGNTGTDQHGDRYFLQNGKLYEANSCHVISRYNDVNEEIDEILERRNAS